ncbi:MAG: restriction endonuclease [Clostridia bacterium]|nr:restriction endonuclease [Clostridia bacterium]
MDLRLDASLAEGYHSGTQITRVLSESWAANNMYCPCCGHNHIDKMRNNLPVSDFLCERCGEIFELKAKKGEINNKINDGAYNTMIDRITSCNNPELLVLQYTIDYEITNLILIPKFFFIPSIIEKRKPLSETARRAGWQGCNIIVSTVPDQGRIRIVDNKRIIAKEIVLRQYEKARAIRNNDIDARGWLLDVLNCVNRIETNEFSLTDMYKFVDTLSELHSDNNNVEAKIRQQLQYLRNKGFIEFLGRGQYRKRL